MYEEFFGLQRKPFELVPASDMLYLSRTHRKALSYLEYGFRERTGFILLTGEVGSGKTTLIRNMVRTLGEEVSRAMIFNTMVSAEQLLAMVNEEFGLDPAGLDKVGLLGQLNGFLVDQYARRRLPLLVIDEAQNLSARVLEEVRLLSNLETEHNKLLQIVLVGQPELREVIARPDLRQLRQRIGVSCHLAPLNRPETEDYVLFRLEMAGRRDAVTFGDGAFDILHRHSGGVPRVINILCDFILLTAFVEGTRELGAALVEEVVSDLSFDFPGGHCWDLAKRSPVTGPGDGKGGGDQAAGAAGGETVRSMRDQLGKQARVIKKVIRVQQNQVRRLENHLENIDAGLRNLNRDLARLVSGGDPEEGRGKPARGRPEIRIAERGGSSVQDVDWAAED